MIDIVGLESIGKSLVSGEKISDKVLFIKYQ